MVLSMQLIKLLILKRILVSMIWHNLHPKFKVKKPVQVNISLPAFLLLLINQLNNEKEGMDLLKFFYEAS